MLLSSHLSAASKAEEQRIKDTIKRAMDTKDSKSFLELCYWAGVPNEVKQFSTMMILHLVQEHTLSVSVSIVPSTGGGEQIGRGPDGAAFHPNLPSAGQLQIIRNFDQKSSATATFPLGEKDGKLFIAQPTPVK